MEQIIKRKIPAGKQYAIVILLIGLVSTLGMFFSGFVGYRVIAFALLMTVSLIAMFCDIFPVLLSALLSALIWDFFFIPPRFTFRTGSTEDALTLLMYFVIALVNAVLTYKIRQIEKQVRLKEDKANTVKLYNTLLNSLSHELRTPIATIIGASDNILSESDRISADNKQQLVSEISVAAIRLNQQVENLLNMSRLESGYIQPKKDWCDINELIYTVINRMEESMKNHTLKVHISEGMPYFKLDFGLMEQVLYNILNNAIIYTPHNSEINISAYCSTSLKGHLSMNDENIHATKDNVLNSLVIEITDNGNGFPDEEMPKVFDKFYRLQHSITGGTGLGLSIVRGFVEAHNGNIRLNNLATGGAQFIIDIPAEMSYLNNLKNE